MGGIGAIIGGIGSSIGGLGGVLGTVMKVTSVVSPLLAGFSQADQYETQAAIQASQLEQQGMIERMQYMQDAMTAETNAAIAQRNSAEAERTAARAEAAASKEAAQAMGRQRAALAQAGIIGSATGKALQSQSQAEADEAIADSRYSADLEAESLLWQSDQYRQSAENSRTMAGMAQNMLNSQARYVKNSWQGAATSSILGGIAGAYNNFSQINWGSTQKQAQRVGGKPPVSGGTNG